METWEEIGRSRIAIEAVEVVATNGVAGRVCVSGTKSVPVIPFVWEISSRGVVDELGVASPREVRRVKVGDSSGAADGGRKLPVLTMDEYLRPEADCPRRPFLVSDLSRWRKFLAVPMTEAKGETESGEVEMALLDEPWIDYRANRYVRRESGVRVVTQRVLFVPFAFCLDVVTFPVAFPLGLLVGM